MLKKSIIFYLKSRVLTSATLCELFKKFHHAKIKKNADYNAHSQLASPNLGYVTTFATRCNVLRCSLV